MGARSRNGAMVRGARRLIAIASVAGSCAVASASATAAAPRVSAASAPRVRAASLRQDGQQLVWKVRLDQRFSVSALAHGHHAVCLLIERVRSHLAVRQLCLRPPAPNGHSPRLVYMVLTRAGAKHAHAVAGMVTRASREEL